MYDDDDDDDDIQPKPSDGQPSLRALVARALARGLFTEVSCTQPLGDNEEQLEFESLIPWEGRLLVELWSEGDIAWRAAAMWTPWRELTGDVDRHWTRVVGDGVWSSQEDAVVEPMCAIAPCAAMPPEELLRRREPSLAEFTATAHALRLCSDRRLSLSLAQRLVVQCHGYEDWQDMLRTHRSFRLR